MGFELLDLGEGLDDGQHVLQVRHGFSSGGDRFELINHGAIVRLGNLFAGCARGFEPGGPCNFNFAQGFIGRRTKRGPGTWREAKGARLYLLGKDHRVIHVASWHQIADKAALSTAVGVIAARIPRDRVRIALVAAVPP